MYTAFKEWNNFWWALKKKNLDGQLSLFYLLIVSMAKLSIFQARFLYFADYFPQNTIGLCTHCILVIAGKQDHKEDLWLVGKSFRQHSSSAGTWTDLGHFGDWYFPESKVGNCERNARDM